MSKQTENWEVIEHSWSDTSIVCGGRTILTKSIYDEATEENQEELEDQVIRDFNLIVRAVNNHDRLIEMVEKLLPFASYTGSERKEGEQLLTELKQQ